MITDKQRNPDTRLSLQPYVETTDISGADTDSMLISMWLSGRTANTVRAYRSDIDRFRCHIIKPMRQVTAADIIDFAETLANLATATQHRKLSVVKSLFSYALKLGYIRLDPAAALRLPKPISDRASKLLSVSAIQSVIAASKPGRDRLICRCLYLTGCRESELIGLQASDVRQTSSGYALTITGKGSKVRHIAILERLACDLMAHRDHGTIFQSVRGKALDPSTIYRLVRAAGEAAGHSVTPHLIRHAHASHALDAGASLPVVRDSLGHGSLQTTSIYLHARPEDGAGLYLKDK